MRPEHARQIAKMERWARMLGNAVDEIGQEQFGKKMGFVIYIFEFGESQLATYLSNGQREDCVKALRELLERIETKGFTGTTQETN